MDTNTQPPESLRELNPSEMADFLGVTTRTLQRWREKGDGPEFYMLGREPRYPLAWHAEWREAQRVRSRRPAQADWQARDAA